MTHLALQLLEQARQLSQEDRDMIAAELRRGPVEPQDVVDAAWAKEIARRVREVRAGTAETVDADECIAELLGELGARRAEGPAR